MRFLGALLVASLLPALNPCAQPARHYAPDRPFDVVHLQLDLTPDFAGRTIAGTATVRLKPVAMPLPEARLDAVELNIRTLESTEPVRAWHVTTNQVVVHFQQPVPVDREVTLTLRYDAEPKSGLYFRTPELGYRDGETHLFTQGESVTARNWYPCFDAPHERFTTELICRVPEGMTALSNGRLLSREPAAGGLTAFHWLQDQPHPGYLVSLVAGHFQSITNRHRDVPLAFHVLPSELPQAAPSFAGTAEMMAYFEEETGVPYPWARYDQVCVNDFVAGGMENTSMTTLTDGTLFTPATENLQTSEDLVAHELAHQWFGDLVTCKDWSQLWLNEGFATYYETLWLGRRHGTDALRYELLNRLRSLTADPVDTRPIVRRTFGHPDDMFNHLTYPKAGWVLHMLRAQLGPDLFRRCIRAYLERHRLGSVITEDLNAVVEELSGRSWDQFFDQWIYHGGYPELHAAYSWDEGRKIARISLAQRQAVNDQVLLFRLPLTIRFRCGAQVIDHTAVLDTATQDVEVPLPAAPDTVRIDPELAVLSKVRFELPLPMIFAQLADTNDVVGRLLAVEVLSARKDQSAVDHLRTTLNEDPFHGVRSEAARALRSIHSEAALDALVASRAQADARVRLAVVESIGGFYRDRAFEALQETFDREPNPAIRGAALEQLAGYARPGISNLLVQALDSETYRNRLAEAALRGGRLLDHPGLAPAVLSCLQTNNARFTADGFGLGLETLAFLARNDLDRSGPREFLLGHLEHRRRAVREAAARALGALGDPQALGPLQKLAGTAGHPPDARAAEQAAGTLRAGRRPVDDFKNLRDEVLELQRSTRELRQQLDELKNRQSTSSAPPAVSVEPAPPATKKKARAK